MPPPDIADNDPGPAIANGAKAPRRSPAVRRVPHATPKRRASADKTGIPNSAPAQTRPGAKKAEPTLLGDFLLGRPSVSRSRRKSVDVVKTEMKRAAVSKVQPPGGVKDRVKQWQKASAAAVIEDIDGPPSEPDETFMEMDGRSVTEDDRRRIKFRKNRIQNLGRQKVEEKEVGSPKKRVVSDDHWMVKEKKRSPPRNTKTVSDPPLGNIKIPKDFLKCSINPPLEKKMEDWTKRTDVDQTKRSEPLPVKDRRDSTNGEIEILASSGDSNMEGKWPLPSPNKPISDSSKQRCSDAEGKGEIKDNEIKAHRASGRRSSKKHKPLGDSRASGIDKSPTIQSSDEASPSCTTPTPAPRRSVRCQESTSPESLTDIPVGYSAFSVLEIPVRGDAAVRQRVKPQRQPSFSAVPKVLKRVYNGGMKIVHDTVEPSRTGMNQPPSIESWLKGTSDPFYENPPVHDAVAITIGPVSGRRNRGIRMADMATDTTKEDANKETTSKPRRTSPPDLPRNEAASSLRKGRELQLGIGESREDDSSSSYLPKTLKRSPATRQTSSPKSSKQLCLIDKPDNQSDLNMGNSLAIGAPTKVNKPDGDHERATDHRLRSTSSEHRRGRHISNGNSKSKSSPLKSPQKEEIFKHNVLDFSNTVEPDKSCRSESPTNGEYRLSKISSVETFKSSSSLAETSSGLSHTTITQTTISQNTSGTSNVSLPQETQSSVLREKARSRSGLKRRLTKHSDLLSVLSLPDAAVPGKTQSIRSARSVRTSRNRLDKATIPGLLQELIDDEVKYMRELKTLVDGVVPVLLTCVLSKSEAAIAAGLFNPSLTGQPGASVTKPIVDMGVALERLKSVHKHIPLRDSDLLVSWASGAVAVYENYINAWRMGFQDVIVNLAPASPLESTEGPSSRDMPRNTEGDVLNENGERVDVAFLLKRPLVRVKYLAKVLKGINMLKPSDQAAKIDGLYQELLAKSRRRIKEEEARLEDEAANNTDATRARDPRTLAPMEGISIDPTRQVRAKDYFDFSLPHSNGQRIDCRIELLIRDKPYDKSDSGDVLICEIDALGRWLLLPPIEVSHISARAGEGETELIVMITGVHASKEWHELFALTAADRETASEWIQMLGQAPRPPDLLSSNISVVPVLPLLPSPECTGSFRIGLSQSSSSKATASVEVDVPIGERPKAKEVSGELAVQSGPGGNRNTDYSPSHQGKDSNIVQEYPDRQRPDPRILIDSSSRLKEVPSSTHRRELATRYRPRHGLESPVELLLGVAKEKNFDQRPEENALLSKRMTSSPSRNRHSVPGSDQRLSNPTILNSAPILTHHHQLSPIVAVAEKAKKDPPRELAAPDASTNQGQSTLLFRKQNQNHDEAPSPPPHRAKTPIYLDNTPKLTARTPKSKSRRPSSPLKHEYQPSNASGTSSTSDDSDTEQSEDYSDSSEEEELEAIDHLIDSSIAGGLGKKASQPESLYSLPIAPSSSVSQALCLEASPRQEGKTTKLVATISCWSEKGHWSELYPEECSVTVSPGLIQAFIMGPSHSFNPAVKSHTMNRGSSEQINDVDADVNRPLVALELTPIVPLRQSNALDIEIRSPPTAQSSLKCTHTVRFRSRTLQECSALYTAIHSARMENPVYKKLEQERIVGAYGKQSYHEAVGSSSRRSWFGRRKSYRASTRAPSVTVSDNSIYSFASAISRLKNMGGIGGFNIAKSSVDVSQGMHIGTRSSATSLYTRSTGSASSGTTPPQTPSSPSIALSGTSQVVSLGSSNLQIRLYMLETTSRWNELGNAFLTVTHPPRGMRQASSLYHGVEKRIIVTRRQGQKRSLSKKFPGSGSPQAESPGAGELLLDVVLGGGCFSRLGVVGVVMNVWEDVVGDNGEVGTVGAIGGLSGRTRKWMFQCGSAAEATWVFALVGGGGR